MFATRPATPSLEFDELCRAFDRRALAMLFDRDPDTVGRWRKEGRVPHTVETTVDRFWWVMHVACVEHAWSADATRYFLLSIEPELGRRPAELVRESDELARAVARVIVQKTSPPIVASSRAAGRSGSGSAPSSPFDELLADLPDDDDVFDREYRMPSLAGRARPLGGLRDEVDPFRVHYTATNASAIPLGSSTVGT